MVIRVSLQLLCDQMWVTSVQKLRIQFWLLDYPKDPRTHSPGLRDAVASRNKCSAFDFFCSGGLLLSVRSSPFQRDAEFSIISYQVLLSEIHEQFKRGMLMNTASWQTSDNAQLLPPGLNDLEFINIPRICTAFLVLELPVKMKSNHLKDFLWYLILGLSRNKLVFSFLSAMTSSIQNPYTSCFPLLKILFPNLFPPSNTCLFFRSQFTHHFPPREPLDLKSWITGPSPRLHMPRVLPLKVPNFMLCLVTLSPSRQLALLAQQKNLPQLLR